MTIAHKNKKPKKQKSKDMNWAARVVDNFVWMAYTM